MGRRDRHSQEEWDGEVERQRAAREPQGSPPPAYKEKVIKRPEPPVLDLEVEEESRTSVLRPPSSMPPPPPRQQLSDAAAAVMEKVLIIGDLADLTSDERVTYIKAVCESLGLNPLTRPFAYIELQGKLTLYARRDCADQLRRLNGISIEIVSKKIVDEVLTVHVRAMDKYGRTDEDIGAVDLYDLDGKDLANAFMKALTKAKRRVTLSLAGLGFADESEVEDIPSAGRGVEEKPKAKAKAGKKSNREPMKVIQPVADGEKKPLPPLVGASRTVEPIE